MIAELTMMVGHKFVTYMARENDPAIIENWLIGISEPSAAAQARIRLALTVCKIIYEICQDREILQAWLQRKNPHLDGAVAMVLIRRMGNDPELELTLVRAAQRFIGEVMQ